MEQHWAANGNKIPRIVYDCIDAVEKKAMQSVGVYRLSGNTSDIQKLRYSFNQSM